MKPGIKIFPCILTIKDVHRIYFGFAKYIVSTIKIYRWFFWIFIFHNKISILGTLLLQNFVRKPIKLILCINETEIDIFPCYSIGYITNQRCFYGLFWSPDVNRSSKFTRQLKIKSHYWKSFNTEKGRFLSIYFVRMQKEICINFRHMYILVLSHMYRNFRWDTVFQSKNWKTKIVRQFRMVQRI